MEKPWTCTITGRPDRYGRALVRCPELARTLVRRGHAMVFALDEPPPSDLVALQLDAQRRKVGMWRLGVPSLIVTGVHSVLEGEGRGYDRVVSTRSGRARALAHSSAYETCEDVCVGTGQDESCLVYVPFRRRYREPPPCLTDPRISPIPPQHEAPSTR